MLHGCKSSSIIFFQREALAMAVRHRSTTSPERIWIPLPFRSSCFRAFLPPWRFCFLRLIRDIDPFPKSAEPLSFAIRWPQVHLIAASLLHRLPHDKQEHHQRDEGDEGCAECGGLGDHGLAQLRTLCTCERSLRLRQMPPPSLSAADPAAASGEVLPSTVTNTDLLALSINPVCATRPLRGK